MVTNASKRMSIARGKTACTHAFVLLLSAALLAGCAGGPADGTRTSSASSPTSSPKADCPELPASQAVVVSPKLPCTSVDVGRAAAATLGFTLRDDGATLTPFVSAAVYDKRVLTAPTRSARELVIAYADNGGVVYLQCSGIVGKTLDPVFHVCTDVLRQSQKDLTAVRKWALDAQATIAADQSATPRLTKGGVEFIACQDKLWSSGVAGYATQIVINSQPVGGGYSLHTLCG